MNSQVDECPICFDTIGDKNNITTECGHKFHASCLMTNVSSNGFNCPCCRSMMAAQIIDSDSDSDFDSDSYSDGSYTTSSDSEEFDQHNSEYMLRGFRFFMNQYENIQHDQEDEADEDEHEEDEADRKKQIAILPTVENITGKLIEKGISMNQVVGAMMAIKIEYKIHTDLTESYHNIWRIIDNMITVEMNNNIKAETIIVTPSIEITAQNLITIQSNKQVMKFTYIADINQDI